MSEPAELDLKPQAACKGQLPGASFQSDGHLGGGLRGTEAQLSPLAGVERMANPRQRFARLRPAVAEDGSAVLFEPRRRTAEFASTRQPARHSVAPAPVRAVLLSGHNCSPPSTSQWLRCKKYKRFLKGFLWITIGK